MCKIGILIIYILILWIISAVLTVYDKKAAANGGRRISERTLLLLGAAGGAGAMLAAMRTVRHKTRKIKFTLSLPIFLGLHIIAICLLLKNGYLNF